MSVRKVEPGHPAHASIARICDAIEHCLAGTGERRDHCQTALLYVLMRSLRNTSGSSFDHIQSVMRAAWAAAGEEEPE